MDDRTVPAGDEPGVLRSLWAFLRGPDRAPHGVPLIAGLDRLQPLDDVDVADVLASILGSSGLLVDRPAGSVRRAPRRRTEGCRRLPRPVAPTTLRPCPGRWPERTGLRRRDPR